MRHFKFQWDRFFAALFISAFLQLHAGDLPKAKPEEVGLSSERLAMITEVLQADVASKKIPGAVLLIARHGKLAYLESVGKVDPATDKPMTVDGIFRVYSMSKPITTVAAMMLVEDGKLNLENPVAMYLPEFAKMMVGVEKPDAGGTPTLELVPARRPISVYDLMRHTSGITYGFFGTGLVKKAYDEARLLQDDQSSAEFSQRVAKLPLSYQPGTTWDYGHSTDILGRVVEVISGKSLFQFEKERLLDPLGMSDTSFVVTDPLKHARVAEPFADNRSIGRNAEFSNPRVAQKFESGGGGMVSTASDYSRFLQMLLNGGSLDGKRFLAPRTVQLMTSEHAGASSGIAPGMLAGTGYGFGLGFAVRRSTGEAPVPADPGEYNWSGAGGTTMWVNPKADLLVVFMVQTTKQNLRYRSLLRNMIYAAVLQ
ncbi:MAG: serine hydrolase domain-containing protein [Comamonadaceae bacterium]